MDTLAKDAKDGGAREAHLLHRGAVKEEIQKVGVTEEQGEVEADDLLSPKFNTKTNDY